VDETLLKIGGRWRYVFRAIDEHGQVVDWSYPARADGLWLGQDSSGWDLRSYSAGLR
jgi:hypothetical protein